MPHTQPVIDTYLRVETAEAIDVFLRPAGVFARSRAYAVDLLLRLVWLIVSSMILGLMAVTGGWVLGLMFLNLFFTMWLYPVVFEVFWNGQTPGKRLFNLQVVGDNGARITWSASLLRNLLRLVDGLPFLYAVGMSAMLMHPHGKRIGDMLAATLVVHTEHENHAARLAALKHIKPLAPPVALTREEQRMITAFAERQHRLPQARRQELAEELAVAVYGHVPAGIGALDAVLGMALHIMGEREA
ncbi:putative RDD family membrane protein YckC [Neisseria sp. HSC-16F19]|nr:RDD family protein [Neisseria sp. HSC-16F19]MCP2040508.1 putative RDD family membrane protein YckC [Neisseria sp. HSC-16F19]